MIKIFARWGGFQRSASSGAPHNPRIDKHHAAWYPSLLDLLTAWVARGSLSFQDLQLFFAQFESTFDMLPPSAAPAVKPAPESTVVDLTGAGTGTCQHTGVRPRPTPCTSHTPLLYATVTSRPRETEKRFIPVRQTHHSRDLEYSGSMFQALGTSLFAANCG